MFPGFGIMGMAPELQVGSFWTLQKDLDKKCKILESEVKSDGITIIYHMVIADTGWDIGWYTRENVLKFFVKWEDPYAKQKEICKRDGWKWDGP